MAPRHCCDSYSSINTCGDDFCKPTPSISKLVVSTTTVSGVMFFGILDTRFYIWTDPAAGTFSCSGGGPWRALRPLMQPAAARKSRRASRAATRPRSPRTAIASRHFHQPERRHDARRGGVFRSTRAQPSHRPRCRVRSCRWDALGRERSTERHGDAFTCSMTGFYMFSYRLHQRLETCGSQKPALPAAL